MPHRGPREGNKRAGTGGRRRAAPPSHAGAGTTSPRPRVPAASRERQGTAHPHPSTDRQATWSSPPPEPLWEGAPAGPLPDSPRDLLRLASRGPEAASRLGGRLQRLPAPVLTFSWLQPPSPVGAALWGEGSRLWRNCFWDGRADSQVTGSFSSSPCCRTT